MRRFPSRVVTRSMLSDAAEYRSLDPGAFERGTNERACERELQSSVGENPKAIIRTTDTTHDERELFFSTMPTT
jgi:hypothetical protein